MTCIYNSDERNLNIHHSQKITSHKSFNCAVTDRCWTQNDVCISSKIKVVICLKNISQYLLSWLRQITETTTKKPYWNQKFWIHPVCIHCMSIHVKILSHIY